MNELNQSLTHVLSLNTTQNKNNQRSGSNCQGNRGRLLGGSSIEKGLEGGEGWLAWGTGTGQWKAGEVARAGMGTLLRSSPRGHWLRNLRSARRASRGPLPELTASGLGSMLLRRGCGNRCNLEQEPGSQAAKDRAILISLLDL